MPPFPLFLALFLCFFGCVSRPPALHADVSLVRPWSRELSRSQPLPAPFVAEFSSGPHALTYAAVEHEQDGAGKSLQVVRKLAGMSKYDVIVLEGFPRGRGMSPASLREEAARDGVDNFFSHGETSVAIQGAVAKGRPFVGAEPEESQLKSIALASGFTLEDLFGFYVVRQVPEWKRDGTLAQEKFSSAYAKFRKTMGPILGLDKNLLPTPESFREWFARKNGEEFHVHSVTTETVAPYVDGSLFTQRISALVGRVRDQHVVRVIAEMLGRYNKVLVVFGASHFSTQEPALQAMLGKPVSIADDPFATR